MKLIKPFTVFRLKGKRRETANVNTLIFDKPLDGANPGQFVMVWLPDIGEKPFCVADADPFTITVAVAGDFSHALHALGIGQHAWVRGPFGQGFNIHGRRHLLVGGGYGAAPLLYLAKQMIGRGHTVMACLGARSAMDLLLEDAFLNAGCETRVITDDGSRGMQGQVTQAVAVNLEEFQPDTLYACGPVPMLSALAPICRERGLPAQLSYEALMRCGIGLCGSCELDNTSRAPAGIPSGWLTCKDGPVFFIKV
jgi:dihydroorotate dehydrogenase electron transfer subunit